MLVTAASLIRVHGKNKNYPKHPFAASYSFCIISLKLFSDFHITYYKIDLL